MNRFDYFIDCALADYSWSAYTTVISDVWIYSSFSCPRYIQIELGLFCVSEPDVFARTYFSLFGLQFDLFCFALLLGQVLRPSIFDLQKSIEFEPLEFDSLKAYFFVALYFVHSGICRFISFLVIVFGCCTVAPLY